MTENPTSYTPNLSGITVGKPVALSGIAIFLSATVDLLVRFGVPLTDTQADALHTWFNQAEILLLPIITYLVMKKHFHATAVDLLHTRPPTPITPVPSRHDEPPLT